MLRMALKLNKINKLSTNPALNQQVFITTIFIIEYRVWYPNNAVIIFWYDSLNMTTVIIQRLCLCTIFNNKLIFCKNLIAIY